MVLSFLRASKFRQWLARTDCPPALARCKAVLDGLEDGGADTTPDSDAFKERRTPRELLLATGLYALYTTDYIRYKGVGLRADSLATNEVGNSLVMVKAEDGSTTFPVRIAYIYIRDGMIKLAVHRLLPSRINGLSRALDAFQDLQVSIYSATFEDSLLEIPVTRVDAHYAWWDLSGDVSLVLDLDQVR